MGIRSSRPQNSSSPMPVNVAHQGQPSTRGSWSDPPRDVFLAVLARTKDARELTRYSLVNKAWQTCASEPQLWQAVARAMHLPDHPSKDYRTAVKRACIVDANMRQGRPTKEQVIQHQDWVSAAVFSPDGSKLATGSRDRTERLSDVHTGATLATIQHQSGAYAVAISPDGSKLATGSCDGTVRLMDYGPRQNQGLAGMMQRRVRHLLRCGSWSPYRMPERQ